MSVLARARGRQRRGEDDVRRQRAGAGEPAVRGGGRGEEEEADRRRQKPVASVARVASRREPRERPLPMTETNFLRYLQLDCSGTNFPNNFFQSSRTREARINGSRIMENEFDLSEVEELEDIPGRPSTGD